LTSCDLTGLSKEKICRSIRKVSGYPPTGSTPSRHMSPQRHPMRFTQEAMKQVGRRGARPRAPLVVLADDMVRAGLVETLAHPGGNVTGVSILATELDSKRLQILLELLPGTNRIGALIDPKTTAADQIERLVAAGRALSVELSIFRAAVSEEIGPAIEAAVKGRVQALNVLASAFFNANRAMILKQVAEARLPAMYQWPDYGAEGALVCYGPRLEDLYRQAAGVLRKVLSGTRPADIPVEQPTKIELVLNTNTTKALGLVVPSSLLLRADEVIE
jgi:putative ABC transport system substrate-binding protein